MNSNHIFWDRFYSLCLEKNTKPNPVAKELDISSGVLTKWKSGTSFPNGEFLIKIANYFGCSIDYLFGISGIKNPHKNEIPEKDMILIRKYHQLDLSNQQEISMLIDLKIQLQRSNMEASSPSDDNLNLA